jgi:hypothetical protein
VHAPGETAASAAVEACLGAGGAHWRRVAPGEWGLRAEAAGWPLDVGIALRGGLLRAQAEVLGPERSDPRDLLRRNRRLVLVRLGHTRAGAVWVAGELPASAATEAEVDRLLGLLVEAADDVRAAAAQAQAASARRRA